MSGVKTFLRSGIRRQLLMVAVTGSLMAGLHSCKREIPKRELLTNYEVNTYAELFKVFWNGMNTNYLFWDQEKVNWDSMYRVYKPRFDTLDLLQNSDTITNRCFQYMADM